MNITNVKKSAYLIIENILYQDEQEEKQLNNLGVIIGESLQVFDIDSLKHAYFVSVGDNRFYINEPLARRIEVSYE